MKYETRDATPEDAETIASFNSLMAEENNERARETYKALGMIHPNYQFMEGIFGDSKC